MTDTPMKDETADALRVEQVARVLCKCAGHDPDGGPKWGFGWINYEDDARAVLAALSDRATDREGATPNEIDARIADAMQQAASRSGVTVSDWIATRLKDAADHALAPARQPIADPAGEVGNLVARLREIDRGQGHAFNSTGPYGEGCRTVVPYGNMMNEAADTIATLTARLAQAEGEAKAFREALRAEDDYWAANRAHACALPRLQEGTRMALTAAESRREAARAALATPDPQAEGGAA